MIEVVEDEERLPYCVGDPLVFGFDTLRNRKFYTRSGGITSGWNDTDLFYADGDGALVQITTAMVNGYWDPKYEGYEKLSGPDWTKNCEDYAKAGGFGDKLGDYNSKDTLSALLGTQRGYVLNMGYHWMRVAKTGDDALTIQQKDQESAVYKKDYSLDAGLTYILDKYSTGGSVYKNN